MDDTMDTSTSTATSPTREVGTNLSEGGWIADVSTRTVTIVRERLTPLVLKLRHPQLSLFGLGSAMKPDTDIDQTIDQLADELIADMTRTVDAIRDEVKSTRPHEGEENYDEKMAAYLELVACVTEIMKRLTKTVGEAFTQFRSLIDQLWEDMRSADGDDEVQEHVQRFHGRTEAVFREALSKDVEPLLDQIQENIKNQQRSES